MRGCLWQVHNLADTIRVQQRAVSGAPVLRVAAGARAVVCWPEPAQPRHLAVFLASAGPAAAAAPPAAVVDMDAVGSVHAAGAARLAVVAVGPTRVLRVTHAASPPDPPPSPPNPLLAAQDAGAGVGAGVTESPPATAAEAAAALPAGTVRRVVRVRVGGVGVSVVDRDVEEVLYASAAGIRADYVLTGADWSLELLVAALQVTPLKCVCARACVRVDYPLELLGTLQAPRVPAWRVRGPRPRGLRLLASRARPALLRQASACAGPALLCPCQASGPGCVGSDGPGSRRWLGGASCVGGAGSAEPPV